MELTHELEPPQLVPLLLYHDASHPISPTPRSQGQATRSAFIVHFPCARVQDAQISEPKTTEALLQAAQRPSYDCTTV